MSRSIEILPVWSSGCRKDIRYLLDGTWFYKYNKLLSNRKMYISCFVSESQISSKKDILRLWQRSQAKADAPNIYEVFRTYFSNDTFSQKDANIKTLFVH